MKPTGYQDLPERERDWLDAYLDQTISDEDFAALQERLMESPELRLVFRRYLALDSNLGEELFDGESWAPRAWSQADSETLMPERSASRTLISLPAIGLLAAAATIAFVLGLVVKDSSASERNKATVTGVATDKGPEPSAEGFAAIMSLSGVEWLEGQESREVGEALAGETLAFGAGLAEVQFFSGASMVVEGPAEILIKSAWEAVCREGSVRMRVPPAARGFRLHAPSTEIVDLGTEFGLSVRDGQGHVEVFEGEIEIRHREESKKLAGEGAAYELASDRPSAQIESGRVSYPDAKGMDVRKAERRQTSFAKWKSYSDTLARDSRLIGYFTFGTSGQGLVPNRAFPNNRDGDGAVVLAERVDGRWPGLSQALEFRKPGSRVRVNLPGEFEALTFMCWVRIDSLDRWYNALFMADGYETGEPHWQIQDDGRLMLSIMVDDQGRHPVYPEKSRYHHIYYSPPVWNHAMSGQWIHLASVFDPINGVVCHYANGERISREEIDPLFLIKSLRIGNGEIGNWGQSFRKDPSFAIRNLNGRMDEIAIFKTALEDAEMRSLYQKSRAER